MPTTTAIGRLDAIVHRTAIIIGSLAAFAVPAGFGLVAYLDEVAFRQYEASLSAETIARYAYVQGNSWRFSEDRVAELVSRVMPPNNMGRQIVGGLRGEEIARIGEPQALPVLRAVAPIVAGTERVGQVTIEASLQPLIARLGLAALLGGLLGLSVYGCVHFLPLRALRRVTRSLEESQSELRAQFAGTRAALAAAETERARAELANRTKSEFLANISHELRTPLNAVIGFSDMLKNQTFGPLSERYRSYSEDIQNSGILLLAIINDLLDISKIEAGMSSRASRRSSSIRWSR